MSSAPLASLRRLARKRPTERCDMCSSVVAGDHDHVVDLQSRALMCACRPCYLLFADSDAHLHYRAVPGRYQALESVPDLDVPVSLYFAFRNSVDECVVVCYPGPAGTTESTLLPATDLPGVRPDVEAVLVHDDAAYLVPIDACYELTGRLRTVWRGFDGGREAREEISRFFTRVRERSAT